MNKRGDIPTSILVLGVFFVCVLAIGSFVYSGFLINKSFEGISNMENANIEIEKNPSADFYDEIIGKSFSLNWDFDFIKERVVFSVQYFGKNNN